MCCCLLPLFCHFPFWKSVKVPSRLLKSQVWCPNAPLTQSKKKKGRPALFQNPLSDPCMTHPAPGCFTPQLLPFSVLYIYNLRRSPSSSSSEDESSVDYSSDDLPLPPCRLEQKQKKNKKRKHRHKRQKHQRRSPSTEPEPDATSYTFVNDDNLSATRPYVMGLRQAYTQDFVKEYMTGKYAHLFRVTRFTFCFLLCYWFEKKKTPRSDG